MLHTTNYTLRTAKYREISTLQNFTSAFEFSWHFSTCIFLNAEAVINRVYNILWNNLSAEENKGFRKKLPSSIKATPAGEEKMFHLK